LTKFSYLIGSSICLDKVLIFDWLKHLPWQCSTGWLVK